MRRRTYHSSRCARDRDRLRQQVLEDRGWSIARVWSTDWFRDPASQTRKVVELLAKLRTTPRSAKPAATTVVPTPDVARRAPISVGPPTPRVSAYVEASFPSLSTPIHELPVEHLASVVAQILDIEGPVHRDEIAKRVTSLWGLARTGSRIGGAVDDALRWLESRNRASSDVEFFSVPGRPVVPRDRENTISSTLRKAEYLPPLEVRAAVTAAVHANQGIDEERLLIEALRLLGFKTVGAQVRSVASAAISGVASHEGFGGSRRPLVPTVKSPAVGTSTSSSTAGGSDTVEPSLVDVERAATLECSTIRRRQGCSWPFSAEEASSAGGRWRQKSWRLSRKSLHCAHGARAVSFASV